MIPIMSGYLFVLREAKKSGENPRAKCSLMGCKITLFQMIGQYLVKTGAESVVAGIVPVGFPRNHVLYFHHFSPVFASCALPC